MPYIKNDRREAILAGETPKDAGELNFAITSVMIDATSLRDPTERYPTIAHGVQRVCEQYLKDGLRYQKINDVVGALHCAAKEYRRRVGDAYAGVILHNVAQLLYDRIAVPYELTKIEENGDLPFVPVPK